MLKPHFFLISGSIFVTIWVLLTACLWYLSDMYPIRGRSPILVISQSIFFLGWFLSTTIPLAWPNARCDIVLLNFSLFGFLSGVTSLARRFLLLFRLEIQNDIEMSKGRVPLSRWTQYRYLATPKWSITCTCGLVLVMMLFPGGVIITYKDGSPCEVLTPGPWSKVHPMIELIWGYILAATVVVGFSSFMVTLRAKRLPKDNFGLNRSLFLISFQTGFGGILSAVTAIVTASYSWTMTLLFFHTATICLFVTAVFPLLEVFLAWRVRSRAPRRLGQREITVQDVIATPLGRKAFAQHLLSSLAIEHLSFLIDLEDYVGYIRKERYRISGIPQPTTKRRHDDSSHSDDHTNWTNSQSNNTVHRTKATRHDGGGDSIEEKMGDDPHSAGPPSAPHSAVPYSNNTATTIPSFSSTNSSNPNNSSAPNSAVPTGITTTATTTTTTAYRSPEIALAPLTKSSHHSLSLLSDIRELYPPSHQLSSRQRERVSHLSIGTVLSVQSPSNSNSKPVLTTTTTNNNNNPTQSPSITHGNVLLTRSSSMGNSNSLPPPSPPPPHPTDFINNSDESSNVISESSSSSSSSSSSPLSSSSSTTTTTESIATHPLIDPTTTTSTAPVLTASHSLSPTASSSISPLASSRSGSAPKLAPATLRASESSSRSSVSTSSFSMPGGPLLDHGGVKASPLSVFHNLTVSPPVEHHELRNGPGGRSTQSFSINPYSPTHVPGASPHQRNSSPFAHNPNKQLASDGGGATHSPGHGSLQDTQAHFGGHDAHKKGQLSGNYNKQQLQQQERGSLHARNQFEADHPQQQQQQLLQSQSQHPLSPQQQHQPSSSNSQQDLPPRSPQQQRTASSPSLAPTTITTTTLAQESPYPLDVVRAKAEAIMADYVVEDAIQGVNIGAYTRELTEAAFNQAIIVTSQPNLERRALYDALGQCLNIFAETKKAVEGVLKHDQYPYFLESQEFADLYANNQFIDQLCDLEEERPRPSSTRDIPRTSATRSHTPRF